MLFSQLTRVQPIEKQLQISMKWDNITVSGSISIRKVAPNEACIELPEMGCLGFVFARFRGQPLYGEVGFCSVPLRFMMIGFP